MLDHKVRVQIVFIFLSTLIPPYTLDTLGSHQDRNFEHDPTQAQSSQLRGDNREVQAARPQRQKRSTHATMEQLSELLSRPANRGGARGRGRGHARSSRGKKVSVDQLV
jgi:hypothetical protein